MNVMSLNAQQRHALWTVLCALAAFVNATPATRQTKEDELTSALGRFCQEMQKRKS